MASRITRTFGSVVHAVAPSVYRDIQIHRKGYLDIEMRFLPHICSKQRLAYDVGASVGAYTLHLQKYSKACIAFEPISESVEKLEALVSNLRPSVTIHTCALSDTEGTSELKVLIDDVGRSTIEPENSIEEFGDVECRTVAVTTLDNHISANESVGFIKIDVEGHEEQVLRGACNLLQKDRPVLLIESEERHKPGAPSRIYRMLSAAGYAGMFVYNNVLLDYQVFDPAIHQNVENAGRRELYANNFLYLPLERRTELLQRIRKIVPLG